MKKIALLLVVITTFLGCSVGEADKYTEHFLPIDSYTLPSAFVVNTTYTITLNYQKPTACYNFRDVYVGGSDNTRIFAIYTDTKDGDVCSATPIASTVSLQYTPSTVGTYTFKFYKGPDVDGNDTFEEVQFEVTAN